MQNQPTLPSVLIIDDVDHQRRLYELISERIGINACVVASGHEGLEAVQTMNFDLVIVDWMMPELDGLSCARSIRDLLTTAGQKVPPIICVSARAYDADRAQVLQAGLDDYLSKPFTFEQLRSRVQKWLHTEKKCGASLDFQHSQSTSSL